MIGSTGQRTQVTVEGCRLLAFIYFACAAADASWAGAEALALLEFLEQQAGDLTRAQSTILVLEAHHWISDVPGNDARLREIEDKVPLCLGNLSPDVRAELLENVLELVLTDPRICRDEDAMHARIRGALLGTPPMTDFPELRLIAFMLQLLLRADGRVDPGERDMLRVLLRARAPRATMRQLRETIEQAAAWYDAAKTDEERIVHLEHVAETLRWTLSAHERRDLLAELIRVASADGRLVRKEGSVDRAIRGVLVSSLQDEELRLLAFIHFACTGEDRGWTGEEHVALFEFLEATSSGLSRERSLALSQDAYQWVAALESTEAHIAVLADQVPRAFAHVSADRRAQLLTGLFALGEAAVQPARSWVREHVRAFLS